MHNRFLPDPRGAGLQEAFKLLSFRTSVSIWFSCILHRQYTSDLQKLLVWALIINFLGRQITLPLKNNRDSTEELADLPF